MSMMEEKNLINLQLFAEDANVQQESQIDTESSVAVPNELEGVSPEIAQEIMKEAGYESDLNANKEKGEPSDPDANEEGTGQEDTDTTDGSAADADSDTKQVAEEPVLQKPKKPIPYQRFKEINDKLKAAEEELEKLKKKPVAISDQKEPLIQEPHTGQPERQIAAQPPFQVTPEISGKIEEYARQEAMKMTGFSKEDIEALAYSEDGDTKKTQWNTALNLARGMITNSVVHAAQVQQQREATFMQQHQALVQNFNTFAEKEANEGDFSDIRNYATTDFFATKTEAERNIIAAAWDRVTRNTASPAEYLTVMNYFKEAKGAYRDQKQSGAVLENKESATQSLQKTKEKIAQANKQPRSSQIDGSASTDGKAVTVASLQHMIETVPWDQIPDEYKNMLKAGTINQ